MRDTDKSQYPATIESDNCSIIGSPILYSHFNLHTLTAQGRDLPIFRTRAWLQLRMSRILFAAKSS